MSTFNYCPQTILQELILNLNFSKVEIAKFIQSHSKYITAALYANHKDFYMLFKNEQITQLVRVYNHIQSYNHAHKSFYKYKKGYLR